MKLHERYTGRHILRRLEELNQTQWLSYDELMNLQQAKLQRLVEYAYEYVPYYRNTFDRIDFHPQDLRRNPDCLSQLPILTKTIIHENWNDLLTREPHRRKQMSRLSTSGSTGEPLVFMQDSDFRDMVTADIQRHIGWAGWKLGNPQAFIWGASKNKRIYPRIRARFIDFIWNRVQTNAFYMTDQTMTAFAAQIFKQKPAILFGYATGIHRFAQFLRQSNYRPITFQGIFTSAEQLLPSVREFIEDTFQCKVYNRYGTLELGGVACECEAHTGLHVSVENNIVEIVSGAKPALHGDIGDIIVTNLNNFGMPFIRYRIGDAGAWSNEDLCPCGRAAPRLKAIEGRIVESFHTRDGRTVWSGFAGAAFRCLAHPAITQFQIVQKSLDHFLVRLIKNGELPQSVLNEIQHGIQMTYGENILVDFEIVKTIPPLPSGKHQYAISEINKK